ncbi:PKD-like family protein [Solitalea koreensis]|uniref:PKD-like family protein n=2 Tax=Solitalea koreensis TaxID=543615 RepID=A0A521DYW8_9SPHI|nr:PKD-like family protein [Solitalea koreensis]
MKQVNKILTIFLNTIFATAILTGCSKDLGNYDYQDINTLKISTDMTSVDPNIFVTADSINLTQNDSLKVKLKIEQSLGSAENFKYQWILTQADATGANPVKHIIDSTAALATKISLTPNLYRLVAMVTDKNTGVSYYKKFALNVNAAPWGNEGWLILQAQPDGSDISVITSRDGASHGKVYPDVYSIMNDHKLPKGTNKVNIVNYTASLRAQKISFFYPNGGMQVRSIDYADSLNAENWFATPVPINFQSNSSALGQWEYLINNGQLSFRSVNVSSLKTPPINFQPPFLGTYTLSPFVLSAPADAYVLCYDNANRCFVQFNVSTGALYPVTSDIVKGHFPLTTATTADLDPTTGKGFDLNNKTGLLQNLVYAENAQPLTTANPFWYCFFRNDAGDVTYLVQVQHKTTAADNKFTTGRYLLNQATCPGINSATMFACPTHLAMTSGAFYYVNGSNIYTCKPRYAPGTTTAAVGLSFPAGTIIKAMKTFNSGYLAANIPSATEGKVLVVATDETASGGGNKVYFFNLNATTGDIMGTPTSPADVYTGFDKITDIAFKKALGK